jgi:hypothetical protein
MSIKTNVDLKAAFEGREVKAPAQAGDLPARIREDAPTPALRPGGSWKQRAAAIDQAVREARDAAKAKKEWAARIKPRHRRSMGMAFRMSAKQEDE